MVLELTKNTDKEHYFCCYMNKCIHMEKLKIWINEGTGWESSHYILSIIIIKHYCAWKFFYFYFEHSRYFRNREIKKHRGS